MRVQLTRLHSYPGRGLQPLKTKILNPRWWWKGEKNIFLQAWSFKLNKKILFYKYHKTKEHTICFAIVKIKRKPCGDIFYIGGKRPKQMARHGGYNDWNNFIYFYFKSKNVNIHTIADFRWIICIISKVGQWNFRQRRK